jgi:hypothetical protein
MDTVDIILKLHPDSVARLRQACMSAPIYIHWEHAWVPLAGNADPSLLTQWGSPIPFQFGDCKYVYDPTVQATRWLAVLEAPMVMARGQELATKTGTDPREFLPIMVAINDMPPLSSAIRNFLANLEHTLVHNKETFHLIGEFATHDPGQVGTGSALPL